nr:MAG TPA: hypothetical protein [Caudoviricetes sp.]
MQQTFTISLDVDTEGIARRITDSAEQTIIDRIYADIEKQHLGAGWGRKYYYSKMVEKAAEKFLDEHKDEIISGVVSRYLSWAKHSSKVRNAVEEVTAD